MVLQYSQHYARDDSMRYPMARKRKARLSDCPKRNTSGGAFGRSPSQIIVALAQPEVMHLWLALPAVFHHVSTLKHKSVFAGRC